MDSPLYFPPVTSHINCLPPEWKPDIWKFLTVSDLASCAQTCKQMFSETDNELQKRLHTRFTEWKEIVRKARSSQDHVGTVVGASKQSSKWKNFINYFCELSRRRVTFKDVYIHDFQALSDRELRPYFFAAIRAANRHLVHFALELRDCGEWTNAKQDNGLLAALRTDHPHLFVPTFLSQRFDVRFRNQKTHETVVQLCVSRIDEIGRSSDRSEFQKSVFKNLFFCLEEILFYLLIEQPGTEGNLEKELAAFLCNKMGTHLLSTEDGVFVLKAYNTTVVLQNKYLCIQRCFQLGGKKLGHCKSRKKISSFDDDCLQASVYPVFHM